MMIMVQSQKRREGRGGSTEEQRTWERGRTVGFANGSCELSTFKVVKQKTGDPNNRTRTARANRLQRETCSTGHHRLFCPRSCCGREQQLNYGPWQRQRRRRRRRRRRPRKDYISFVSALGRRLEGTKDGRTAKKKGGREREREQNYQRRTKTSRGEREKIGVEYKYYQLPLRREGGVDDGGRQRDGPTSRQRRTRMSTKTLQ